MGLRELLILVLILAIVAVILRGLVVALRSRKNRIKIALEKNIPVYDLDELELRELPNGGARMVQRSFEEVMRQASELESLDAAKKRPRSKGLKTDLTREAVLARRAAALAAAEAAVARGEAVADPDLFSSPASSDASDDSELPEESPAPHVEPATVTGQPEWAAAALRADEYQSTVIQTVSQPASPPVPMASAAAHTDYLDDDWMDDVSPVREVVVRRAVAEPPAVTTAARAAADSVRTEPTFSMMRFDDELGLVDADPQPAPASGLYTVADDAYPEDSDPDDSDPDDSDPDSSDFDSSDRDSLDPDDSAPLDSDLDPDFDDGYSADPDLRELDQFDSGDNDFDDPDDEDSADYFLDSAVDIDDNEDDGDVAVVSNSAAQSDQVLHQAPGQPQHVDADASEVIDVFALDSFSSTEGDEAFLQSGFDRNAADDDDDNGFDSAAHNAAHPHTQPDDETRFSFDLHDPEPLTFELQDTASEAQQEPDMFATQRSHQPLQELDDVLDELLQERGVSTTVDYTRQHGAQPDAGPDMQLDELLAPAFLPVSEPVHAQVSEEQVSEEQGHEEQVHEEMTHALPEELAADGLEELPEELPAELPTEVPGDLPEEAPVQLPEEMPAPVQPSEPEYQPASVPPSQPEYEPEHKPEYQPDTTPPEVPEPQSDPEDVPADVPAEVPEEVPEEVPADVPEEAPVPDSSPQIDPLSVQAISGTQQFETENPDFENQEPGLQEPEIQEPEIQEPEIQEPEHQEPEPSEPEEEEEPLPDFDSELEIEPEPQPQPVDSFAAVDNKDNIDDLFKDEDQQRRLEALEQEQESTPKRFMSWAGATFGKLTSGLAESRARAAEEKAAREASAREQAAALAQKKELQKESEQQKLRDSQRDQAAAREDQRRTSHDDVSRSHTRDSDTDYSDTNYADPLADYAVDDVPYDAEHWPAEEPAHDGYRYADADQPQEYDDVSYDGQPYHDPEPATPVDKNVARYGESPYKQHQFGHAPAGEAAATATSAAAAASAAKTQPQAGPQQQSRPQQPKESLRSARENQLSLEMPEDDDFNDGGFSQVLVINVMARPNTSISGDELLPALLAAGLRFGDMSIFHRHADRRGGPVLFSVANALNPGTFDLNEISHFSTQGVTFFMTLPNVANNMLAFEQMLATARHVQSALDADLKDDNRSVMTAQTVEHYRQRIRDFELQQLKNSRHK